MEQIQGETYDWESSPDVELEWRTDGFSDWDWSLELGLELWIDWDSMFYGSLGWRFKYIFYFSAKLKIIICKSLFTQNA